MRRGLVVGKFMPLHRGHQLLIESALSQVDDLTIVIYDSTPPGTYTPMPIRKRIKWIAELYPEVENIVARRDPFEENEDRDDGKYSQAYADDLAFLGHFDTVFSSEAYGQHFATALGAEHVEVDAARKLLPISGSQIRENIFENRGWVDPLVYRSLVQKVVFVGTESVGKSTLAEVLAERYQTRWVHEYGRELWIEQGLTGSFADGLKMARNQYRREEAAVLHSREVLFCDTNAWTTLQWALMYDGTADARLYDLVDQTQHEYIWFLCENDFPWVNDGVRELLGEKSKQFQTQQRYDLAARKLDWHTLSGSFPDRVARVEAVLTQRGILARVPDYETR